MPTTVWITAMGAVVMSGLTIIAALYLLIALLFQGRGKLRVRLLVGMVLSDVGLGIVVFVVEIAYLTNTVAKTGSHGCNAAGFILTTILFTQHLWTLAIAVATFFLLKFPLSRTTTIIDRYSWASFPLIWGVSILHAGIWHATVGWANTGSLCYYATESIGLDRDLVQFIPRALVFVIIALLYSGLFNFLRRPDTIQLSSQFVTGDSRDDNNRNLGQNQQSKILRPLGLGKMGRNNSQGQTTPAVVDPNAPWEALEFISIGGRQTSSYIPPVEPTSIYEYTPNVTGGIILPSRPCSPTLNNNNNSDHPSLTSTSRGIRAASQSSATSTSGPSSHRPSASDTLVTPELTYKAEMPGSADSTAHLITPQTFASGGGGEGFGAGYHFVPALPQNLSPVLSVGSSKDTELLSSIPMIKTNSTATAKQASIPDSTIHLRNSDGVDEDWDGDDGGDREIPGQTLKEFFEEYHGPDSGGDGGGSGGGVVGLGTALGSNGEHRVPQMSASAYFNRQASLLMLYFPIAYMISFSASLVRLVYDMVHGGQVNAILSMVSTWLVLSVGLTDGIVYGIAEFVVKRRVRRKMGDHI